MEGFIPLYRKIREWGWYKDGPTKDLFLHILLCINYKPGIWKGIDIQPGEMVTGRKSLSSELGLSENQIRLALDKLVSTGEITRKTTSKYTILRVVNWETYNQQTTNKPPTNHQQTTTNNKNNNTIIQKDNNTETGTSIEVGSQAIVSKKNPDIDNILEGIKTQVQSLEMIYKPGKYERPRANNILTSKEFGAICEKANMSRIDFCKQIILISTKLDFWNGKIFNAETFYKHYAKVYNDAVAKKQEIQREKPKNPNPLLNF